MFNLTTIFQSLLNFQNKNNLIIVKHLNIPSKHLNRSVKVDVFLPPQYNGRKNQFYPTVFFNDGQDMLALGMYDTMQQLFKEKHVEPFIVVAVYASDNRINEYGTARQADYKNRGNKADKYTKFMLYELLPTIRKTFRCAVEPTKNTLAGFSLGGLSALDIGWSNPSVFGKIGIFSGALWWRSQDWQPNDPDGGRIMHDIISSSDRGRNQQKFWFEVGTNDEESDRNNNGIIDAIDDTRDIIDELCALGYRPNEDIKYVEIEGGEHNPQTWGQVMPQFLTWVLTD